MLITLSGPRGAGKSTSASIIGLAIPEVTVISGDDFVLRETSYLESLGAELRARLENGTPVLLEHVTACHLAQSIGFTPDLSVFLTRSATNVPAAKSELDQVLHEISRFGKTAKLTKSLESCQQVISEIVHFCLSQRQFNQIDTFVFKVAARCNLACSYCYMYEAFDEDWKRSPLAMDLKVARQAAKRIREYCTRFSSPRRLSIILHGGEPLTLPVHDLCSLIDVIVGELGDDVQYDLGLQTNGVLLDEARLRLLDERGVNIGLSLDGGSERANIRRPFLSGASSLNRSLAALDLLTRFNFQKGSFSGLLSVSGAAESGSDYYKFLKQQCVRKADILLMGNVSERSRSHKSVEQDLLFLRDLFSEWLQDEDPPSIRLFESIVFRLTGLSWNVDSLGFSPPGLLGITTSGDWEFLDCLRLSDEGAWKSGLTVWADSIESVATSSGFRELAGQRYDYSEQCIKCEVFDVCGGGYLPHRYRRGIGYANPSQNCHALFGIISLIKESIQKEVDKGKLPSVK